MTVSCIVFEIKRKRGQKTIFHTVLIFDMHDHLEPLGIFFYPKFEYTLVKSLSYKKVQNIAEKFDPLGRSGATTLQATNERSFKNVRLVKK